MSITHSPGRRRLGAAAVLVGAILLAFGAFAPQVGADKPEGNNGTVKVDGTEFDTHPNNQPHVGCVFQIDFYGFDAETAVEMEFKVHPPTGNEVIHTENGVLDNDDNTDGGSEAGLDGQFTIDLTDELSSFTPHPQQGYHVKLTITADDGDSQGNQSKHKTYWVSGCEPGGDDGDTTDDVAATDTVQSTTGSQEPTDTEVGGVVVLPDQLPVTGANDRSLLLLGSGLVAIGAVMLVTKRAVLIRS